MTVLFALYNAVRLLAARRASGAFENADRIWQLERWLRLPSEQTLQAAFLDAPSLVRAANGYYASVHFPLTFLFLLWLFVRRPSVYPAARRALVAASAAALLVQVLLPTAPPRMLPDLGFVDTGQAYGQSVYGAVGQDALSNQYAAMPSLHVGWALLVAIVCIRTGHSPLRWLWVLHPAVTLLVVAVTANHFWLDGLIGGLLVAAALRVTATGWLGGNNPVPWHLPGGRAPSSPSPSGRHSPGAFMTSPAHWEQTRVSPTDGPQPGRRSSAGTCRKVVHGDAAMTGAGREEGHTHPSAGDERAHRRYRAAAAAAAAGGLISLTVALLGQPVGPTLDAPASHPVQRPAWPT